MPFRLMIAVSDNTPTNLVLDQSAGKSTNRTMSRRGHLNTRIHAKVFRRETSIDPNRSQQFGLGSTTASETGALLEAIHQGKLVSESALRRCSNISRRVRAREDPTIPAIGDRGGAQDRIRVAGANRCGDHRFARRRNCHLCAHVQERGPDLLGRRMLPAD
ncbi:MAG: hypothetical protein Ct9H300mP1_22350 [Planctomycetaceae bacterium]|nr:MAG: hypothetical protein Ct9H300mP1_22350 [Planctomycetaceae bacterium]